MTQPNTEIDKNSNEELDSTSILGSLCANAPDYEIRDCLRKYDVSYPLKRLTSVFNSVNKSILAKNGKLSEHKDRWIVETQNFASSNMQNSKSTP